MKLKEEKENIRNNLKEDLVNYLLSISIDEDEIIEYDDFINELLMTLEPVIVYHDNVLNDDKEKQKFVELILSIINKGD